MSDELKIELQVESNTTKAEEQLDDLIKKYKNKEPIDLKVKLGNVDLNTFQNNIKSITGSLDTLSKMNFSNLKGIETSLKNISKIAKEYQKTVSATTFTTDKNGGSVLGGLNEFDSVDMDRLSKNHKEALEQISKMKEYAKEVKDTYGEYREVIRDSYKKLREDNADYFSEMNKFENKFDNKRFERLVGYYKELDAVMREYSSLGVNLTQMDKITGEKYDGTMAYRRYQEYIDSMGLSPEKFTELEKRAKELNKRKYNLLKNIKDNIKKSSDEEREALKYLNNLYKNMPQPDLSQAENMRKYMAEIVNSTFELDFKDLDLRFEEDFERLYERFFKILDEVKDEYNRKFKDTDGFEDFNIFDTDNLKKVNQDLDKEILNTADTFGKLKDISTNTLKSLGLDDYSVNAFRELTNSVEGLENKLTSLKEKFSGAFEISSESSQALQKIKDALLEINKLSEEQKQTFFDFGLDTDKIKKAKDDAEDLKVASESVSDVSFDGLIESYSRLESASGQALREIEKIRLSPTSSVTLKYGYEEDEDGLSLERKLQTAEFTDNISKRTKEVISEYTKASKDLMKAQKEYYEAVNGGKSSEETINKLSENVKVMELNLGNIRKNINDLENYPEVMEAVIDSFKKLDDIRYRQSDTDALKIIDKAHLAEANKILKESKTLIDNISKDSIQLQKDMNAGYKETSDSLEDRIKSQEKQLTNNLSKLMNIPNSKAAIDQIFSYQLEKAQKTEIDIQRIKDKANKATGTKIVDEQDEYLKSYKRYLTELKAIQKSLSSEKNESARAEKIFQLNDTFKQLDKIKDKLNEVKKVTASELYDKTMRELDLSFASSFSKTYSELDKVEEKITKLSKSNYANSALVSPAQDAIAVLRNALNKGFGDLKPKDLSAILVEVEKLKKAAKDIDLDIKLSKDSEKIEIFIKGVVDQLEILQSMGNDVDISHITRQFKELAAGSDKNSVVMKSINDDVKNLEKSLKKAGDTASHTGLNFKGFFNDIGDSLKTFTLGEIIGDVITDSLYQTWDIIKEMDAAMSNLKKVADVSDVNTDDKLDSIRSQAIDVAKEVGMASSDVINAIADTLQAGIGSMSESIQVARSAMILANVGDMTQEAASEALNTIINSYKLQPLKEIDVQVGGLSQRTTELANAMDLLNYAGNNYAIGADGVAEAMKRGGTVLSQYGVSLEDSVGLITAANEAIQDPAKVGNALKTISINMAGVKSNASKGTLELNKTAKTLKEIAGIDVYSDKSKGEVKGMVEILDELNQKLKEGKLNQDEFLAISEALAGKENAAVLQSLMGNYETFKQIQSEFAEGLHFGSAEKENAAYVDSLNGKLNKLKEIWIDTLMVLADSDSVKGLLDVFISVSEGINVLIKALDKVHLTLPTIFGLIGGGSSYFKTFSSSMEAAKEAGVQLGTGFTGIKNTVATGVVPALKNFIKQGLLIGGVTLAVQGVAWAWDELTNGVKKAGEKLQAVEDEQLSNISAQNNKIKTLETTGRKYEELANKAKRTAEEESEMVRLGNELATILPEMVIDYDEDGNAILSMTDDMQGLIDKAKEANDQYNRLLLGTRIEQSDNALKLLTKGEGLGKDSKGLHEQKLKIEQDYNEKMKSLQSSYQTELQNARNFEGKTREKALENARKYRNEMLTEESKYMTEYSAVQARIVEQSNIFRDEMDSTWRDSANYLTTELTPELEKSIQKFTNSLDFSEISDENELEAVRRIFRDIPKLAQEGAIDIDDLSSKISKINEEYAKTGDLENYNKQMQELAKTVGDSTGWDASVLSELFTVITDGTLESSTSLKSFLSNYGKTVQDIRNGDSIAKALQEQYNAINDVLNSIANHNFDSDMANYQLRLNIQNNEDIPKQIRDSIDKMVKAGVSDTEIITVTGEILMSLKDGKIDEKEAEILKDQLYNTLKGKMSDKDLELTINAIVESFNSEEVLKDIENRLGKEKVEKEVSIKADDPEKLKKIQEAIDLIAKRPDVDKAVRAVIEGEEDLVFFAEIIKNLPVNETYTNKFIVENASALSKLNSYQEVLDYINNLPDDVKKTYGITTEGIKETSKEVKEIDDTINSVNGNELKVTASNDDVLKTIEDVEALIEISSKVEDGKYKIDINANTQAAIENINLLKESINELTEKLANTKAFKFNVETAQAAKNISGLKLRVDEMNLKKGKTITYKSETAQAAKNITGLVNKVNQIKNLNGKTFKYYASTAQAAKNFSGLIDRVNQINKKNGKTFTWYANTAQAAKNISGLINRIDQINARKGKTVSYTAKVNYSYNKPKTVDSDLNVDSNVSTIANPVSAVADEIASQTTRMQTSLRTGVGEINSFSSNMARATLNTPISFTYGNINTSLKNGVDLLQELYNRVDKVNEAISLLDKRMEKAVGTEKINYLQQQNELLKEQATLQEKLSESLKKQQASYKSYLQQKGFNFNADGNLTNYEEKLNAMKNEEKRLKELADKANDKYSDYSGSNEKYKNQLKSAYDTAKDKADKYSESLAEIEKFLSEYIKITFDELPKVSQEWQDLQNQIKENTHEIDNLNRENRLYKFVNSIKKAQMESEILSDKLDILSKKMELNGADKKSIEESIKLLKEQAKIQEGVISNYKTSINVYKEDLAKYGFEFNGNGSITNLDTILNKYQNSKDLEHIKSIVEEYLKLINDELPDAEKQWLDVSIAIKENEKSLEELLRNQKLDKYTNKILELNAALNKTSNDLDLLSSKLDYAYGKEKLDILDQQIEKYKEQQKIQEELMGQYASQMGVYNSELSKYGFLFDSNGAITNLDETLSRYTGDELEEIRELVNSYLDIQNSKLPEAQKEWQELENQIKDTLKTQLDITKQVEDKITQIYKKQIEERIEALNKETDAKLNALKKQKEAYNKYREDVDYQNEYDEKLAEITELQTKLDIAMRDTSLTGQKKVQELQKQIAEAQKDLANLTQDQIDKNINDMFDKESERIEEENKNNIENLQNQWSDSKIAEMVAQALGSGVFTDIEGNVTSLENALLNFAESTGETFGVLGGIIKEELIGNLQVALGTFKDLSSIMNEFDLSEYTTSKNSRSIDATARSIPNADSYSSNITNDIKITAPIINIEGNVDSDVVQELKDISNKIKNDVINAIASSIR